MSTYRQLGYAIQTHIKQNFDDADVNMLLITYWIKLIANRLKYQRLKKERSSYFLVEFQQVPVEVDGDRRYSYLPDIIFNLDNDTGIDSVFYERLENCENPFVKMSRTRTSRKDLLYKNPFKKPSADNPYYFLNTIIINGERKRVIEYLGIECIDVESVDINLFTQEDPNNLCDLDEEIGVGPEQEKFIYYEVYNLARYGYLTMQDKVNDGTDTTAQMQQSQLVAQSIKSVFGDINQDLQGDNQQQPY